MNPLLIRIVSGIMSRFGFTPALSAGDVPDDWLVEVVEGPSPLPPGRALDVGCGGGRNTLYLARHGWDAVGVDITEACIDQARSCAAEAASSARFILGDVTKLVELGVGDGYTLINDSGCYYLLSDKQRNAFADNVNRVAAPHALLLMAGFTKLPGAGINEDDLRRRFPDWNIRASARVSPDEIMRHTRVPPPLKAGLRSGRLQIRRFELVRR
jgi:SAM-dependent methyltransferase